MNEIDKIEALLLKEFETVPFHNLFMLNNKNVVASGLGGTCSDKVLHFKNVLSKYGISSRLHSAFIDDIECHRMLLVEINNQTYFIDVGSGWPSTKLLPAFKQIEYSVYGMTFKTQLSDENLLLFHKTTEDLKLTCTIPLKQKPEKDIIHDIKNRFDNTTIYPFQNSLRFSKVINNNFYFLKGNRLRIFNQNSITEKVLTLNEVFDLITRTFSFDLSGLEYDFIA